MLRFGFFLSLAVIVAVSTVAHASDQTSKRARVLYEQGLKHYNVGEFKEALDAFKGGYFAKPDPVFLFNMGQAYRQLGDYQSALRQYRAYLRELPDAPNRGEVERLIAATEQRVAAPPSTMPEPTTPKPNPPVGEGTASVEQKSVQTGSEPTIVVVPTNQVRREPARRRSRRWIWGVVVGSAVVVGAAIGIGVALGVPNDAPVRTGTDPTIVVTF